MPEVQQPGVGHGGGQQRQGSDPAQQQRAEGVGAASRDGRANEGCAAAAGEPWQHYDLGHGYCGYTFFEQCQRMACARCDFYTPKTSSKSQLLEAKENLQKMLVAIPLTDEERAAVDDGQAVLDQLLDRLTDVPTPASPPTAALAVGRNSGGVDPQARRPPADRQPLAQRPPVEGVDTSAERRAVRALRRLPRTAASIANSSGLTISRSKSMSTPGNSRSSIARRPIPGRFCDETIRHADR
ncbi:hypothetical protein [Streptacidiphilus albus]|uniref:hypothetical protein n=1 Tax=Streptacidiphilus albus TaxID=105425 RepID=UPI001F2D7450|nr:hypothetical protein [Streptacidiphilus albus]